MPHAEYPDPAEIAYAAYGASTSGRNYRGEPMPTWETLPDGIQTAWRAAAQAVIDASATYQAAEQVRPDPDAPGPVPWAHVDAQMMDAFVQAVRQARETGSATVGFRNGSVDAAGNESIESGYDITVVRVGDGTAPSPLRPATGHLAEPALVEYGEIQLMRHLGRGLVVEDAPENARVHLGIIARADAGVSLDGGSIRIADQVVYEVTGLDTADMALTLRLVTDWRPGKPDAPDAPTAQTAAG